MGRRLVCAASNCACTAVLGSVRFHGAAQGHECGSVAALVGSMVGTELKCERFREVPSMAGMEPALQSLVIRASTSSACFALLLRCVWAWVWVWTWVWVCRKERLVCALNCAFKLLLMCFIHRTVKRLLPLYKIRYIFGFDLNRKLSGPDYSFTPYVASSFQANS